MKDQLNFVIPDVSYGILAVPKCSFCGVQSYGEYIAFPTSRGLKFFFCDQHKELGRKLSTENSPYHTIQIMKKQFGDSYNPSNSF